MIGKRSMFLWFAGCLSLAMSCGLRADSTAARAGAEKPAVDLSWAIDIGAKYAIKPNIVYATSGNVDLRLDLYKPLAKGAKPTLIYMHGGGWLPGYTKERFAHWVLPFLQLGWTVVSVEYRPSTVALAPAAVEDCLCALRWVSRNASAYNVDPKQVVLMGHSAGAALALTTGMIPLGNSGLGGPCTTQDVDELVTPGGAQYTFDLIRPAAVVSWWGITDVTELAGGANEKAYVVKWLGNQPDALAVAKRVSPATYVRRGQLPIISIAGDKDHAVPYSQVARFHRELTEAGVMNKLITLPGGDHGGISTERLNSAYAEVLQFLEEAGLTLQPK